MRLFCGYLFPAMWLSYLGYWFVCNVKGCQGSRAPKPAMPRLERLILMAFAVVLLWFPADWFSFAGRVPSVWHLVYFGPVQQLQPAVCCFPSGRVRHLGTNWSQAVTVKEGHELITSGPYALVRHPIYTGLLMAFVGTALDQGEWRGLFAVAFVFCALWRKLRLEEKWMRSTLRRVVRELLASGGGVGALYCLSVSYQGTTTWKLIRCLFPVRLDMAGCVPVKRQHDVERNPYCYGHGHVYAHDVHTYRRGRAREFAKA